MRKYMLTLAIACVLLLGSCTNPPSESASSPSPVAEETTEAIATPPASETPSSATAVTDAFANLPRLNGEATVVLRVNGGSIVIQVDGTNAPITAGNFVDLVQRGVYNGTVFHRVVRSPEPFVVQGGDPTSSNPATDPALYGTGSFTDPQTGQPRYIPLEIKPAGAEEPLYSTTFPDARLSTPPELRHTRGAVAMARSQFPDSASAQFYVALADLSFLDGSYAVFGTVTEGMEIVDQIQQGNVIESAEVVSGAENLVLGQ